MVMEDVEKPRLSANTGAILKVTSAAICGSDLHMYDGPTTLEAGTIVGHEIMGVIEQVGDRVVLPFNIACGTCLNCVAGFTSACLTMNPGSVGAAAGWPGGPDRRRPGPAPAAGVT